MKLTDIKEEGNDIYLLTYTPSFLEYLFGLRVRIERYYLRMDATYTHRGGNYACINEEGKLLPYDHPATEAINNHIRTKVFKKAHAQNNKTRSAEEIALRIRNTIKMLEDAPENGPIEFRGYEFTQYCKMLVKQLKNAIREE